MKKARSMAGLEKTVALAQRLGMPPSRAATLGLGRLDLGKASDGETTGSLADGS